MRGRRFPREPLHASFLRPSVSAFPGPAPQEEYVFDEHGLIKRLTRSMMTSAGQKLLTAYGGGN